MMLMSTKSIANVKGYTAISKDDVGEVVSKSHNKGRSKTGRRLVKRSDNNRVRKEIRDSI